MHQTHHTHRHVLSLIVFVGMTIAMLAPTDGRFVAVAPQPVAAKEPAQNTDNNGFGPGDIYREYPFTSRTDECGQDAVGRGSCNPNSRWQERRIYEDPDRAQIDTTNAVRAEMAVEFWGGHVGTAQQQVAVNPDPANFTGNPGGLPPGINNVDWLTIPQPRVASGEKAVCYFRQVMGRSIVPLEVGELRDDQRNTFRFRAGNQDRECQGTFSWGLYHIYSFIVRVYYDETVPHPTGRIASLSDGASIGENPSISVDTSGSPVPIEQVDLIAKYTDFDWDGNGTYREWQYRFEQQIFGAGAIRRHIGSRTEAPYTFTWDTTWVPDQDQPIELMARLRGTNGVYYMTPAVSVNLARNGRSVQLFTVDRDDMPENFGVRDGRVRKTAPINITGSNPRANATRGQLIMSTWAGQPRYSEESSNISTEIKLNEQRIVHTTPGSSNQIGREYDYGDVELDLSEEVLQSLRQGNNTFEMFSNRKGHALEVHLPGPALKVEYGGAVVTYDVYLPMSVR
ncbi:MAG: hypothetical protein GFH27_549303n267 [Chloroflexi bacterium AL-W]|nr:hypothetical protein [Chloroflexi bacterium AL-N1]NOK68152.1 hypothetical protein [Chloroflexi bacterium AL-N10]NOK73492.1 hypothetical protein [Chloroflexi bacterium AL-N5]NOK83406.1 hypothetical protein [Chloroflexi bacterium AL-W]NOK87823.1 hypothetical protein [Chloroflexi bacterium AL-N15]